VLEKSFAKVEIYLATFPGDENIENVSVALIACILKAVELAIVFFLSSSCEATFLEYCRAKTLQITYCSFVQLSERFRLYLPI